MLAGQFIGPGRIELVDIPEPELPSPPSDASAPGQMIFQPECTCLCGSDLPFFRGTDEWPIKLGHSLHEMAGTVVDTNGNRFKPGERVLCVPVNQEGLWERFVVDETRAIPLDDRVSEEECMLAQPLGTAIFALKKLPNISPKKKITPAKHQGTRPGRQAVSGTQASKSRNNRQEVRIRDLREMLGHDARPWLALWYVCVCVLWSL